MNSQKILIVGMELIDKAAIVASIERDIKEYSRVKKEHPDCEYYDGALDILEDFRVEFLDIPNTKAVDLDKACKWLEENAGSYLLYPFFEYDKGSLIEDFRKAMEL